MNKKELEKIIGSLEKLKVKKVLFEQYETPPDIVADIAFIAMNDINGKVVADLGCGNGAFAVAAYYMGAREIHCIEIDEDALKIAENNCRGMGIKMHLGDVRNFNIKVNTVLMNPPFGYQLPGADRIFIIKALEIADVIYTLHHSDAIDYLKKLLYKRGEIDFEKDYKLNIPYGFKFHSREYKKIDVKLIKIRVKKDG
ncbi:MAG: METTL5 family protein [Thermoplasmata archaeon]